MASTMYIPLGEYIDSLWPKNILEPPPLDQIDNVWIEPPRIQTEPSINVKTAILIEQELALAIPGVDGVSIVLAAAGEDSAFLFEFFSDPSPGMKIVDIPIAIRFAPDLLTPAKLVTDAEGHQVVQPDDTQHHLDITLAKITLTAEFDGGFGIDVDGGIDLPLCLIGDTGVGIEARDIRFLGANDPPPPGRPAGWSGIHIPSAGLWLPGELGSIVGHLTLTDATIGNGGFSGTVTDTWAPALAAQLGGMDLSLTSVAISFVQNSFTQCEIHGSITLPFFDAPVDVELGINLDGSFSVKLASANGLLTLVKPDVLELEVQSLGFAWAGETFTVKLSGSIRPLIGGLDWPGFEVRELSIDSHGNVKLEGGWIDLRDGYALDFHGFKVEISRIGFGKTDDGGKWIGFSGGLNLVDGFSAGASVEGLKVTWHEGSPPPTKVTLEGVGVEFLIPDAVSFKGHISYREFLDSHGASVRQFSGDITLKLLSLGLEVDAVLVVGSALKPDGHTYTFFAIYIAVELPAGIPLGSTGLAFFGLAGLFALQMEPDKHADEAWYGVGSGDGWYKRHQIGVTDLGGKWRNEEGSLALGAGITIGTLSDNGYTFSARMLLVLVFPGPILMLEGKANLLKERSKLSDEPLFRALAVLDGRAGTLLFGLDVQYKMGAGGELLDIRGGTEAYFDFHDLNRWHIYLGIDEPRDKRIRARIFNLFEANAYFMLDAHSLRTGAWVGYDKRWNVGPVRITLEAWLETNVKVNWKPIHFHGDLWAHGKVEMRVFGFGFGLSLDARLAGDVFDPFHILAELSVSLDLPWPLHDVDVDFTLEWGPRPTPPPIPMVLKEVSVEHLKATTSWPLPRTSLLLPDYDHDGFIGAPSGPTIPGNLNSVPVVPLDCRPHITFGRPVHDAALVGNNPQPPNPAYERIGDPANNVGPARVTYSLRGITLEKRLPNGTWSVVARKADSPNSPGVPELFGSWAPIPAAFGGSQTQSVAQVKLWIWDNNPFSFTRNTSGSWDEWFTDNYPSYPCIPPAPDKHICCNFTRYRFGQSIDSPHSCDPEMTISGFPPRLVTVERLNPPVDGIDRAACFQPGSFMQIRFARTATHIDIHLLSEPPAPAADITCVDFTDHTAERDRNPLLWHDVNFTTFESNGAKADATEFRNLSPGDHWLMVGFRTQIDLPKLSDKVTITLIGLGAEIEMKAEAFDGQGKLVASGSVPRNMLGPVTVVLNGLSISTIQVTGLPNKGWILQVCYGSAGDSVKPSIEGLREVPREVPRGETGVHAVVDFGDGTQSPPLPPVNDHIIVSKKDISAVTVSGSKFCVIEVCADFAPDPDDVENRQEMAAHLQNATARWSQVGAVLEPYTYYRMKIATRAEAVGESPELSGWSDTRNQEEIAYFRTEGPPGLTDLSVPVNQSDPAKFDSGLDDLVRYVKQTVPATVPPPGQKPLLPKPVYRAYDVGVEFNENYVDLMYRISGRDLGLYLFDNNNLPVRDAAGRLIVRQNEWGKVETSAADASEQRWLQVVNTSTCALIDASTIPKDVKLISGAAGQVLKPDSVYEARLMPVLVHENFAGLAVGTAATGPGGILGRWRIVDQGTPGPSRWQIEETPAPVTRYVVQTTNIGGGTLDSADPVKPGSMLIYGDDPNLSPSHADQPARWTDYRVTAYLRNEDNDALGLVFRYVDPNNYYRFSFDADQRYRRLVLVVNGIHTILAEDDRRYQSNVDYAVTVEAIGPSLRVYLDGEPILSAEDLSHAAGGIGLYCWASERARFFDIKVDDFRNADPVTHRPAPVYRFPFTTSKFAHFTHHTHSYDDKLWPGTLAPAANTAAWIAAAESPGAPVTEAESRAFDELSHAVLGSAADGFPGKFEITRVEQNGNTVGFLAQTSEPFDWPRIDLELHSAKPFPRMQGAAPNALKMVSASSALNRPREESVNLLTRDSIDLRGHAVEMFRAPGPIKASAQNDLLFEDFNESGHGVLFEETFGPNALDRYLVLDQGTLFSPSAWSVSGGAILQSSNIAGGGLAAGDNAKPGTMAITGDADWGSVRIRAQLISTDDDGIGIVFRFRDKDNYYRFSTDSERNFRRLIKCENGVFTTLWEDLTVSYIPSVAFDLQIEAYGNRLIGLIDNVVQFDVIDDAFAIGRVGLYSWLNTGAQFRSIHVESLDADPVLARSDLSTLDGWLVLDPAGSVDGPSAWTPGPSGMQQTSLIRIDGAEHIGAHLVTGRPFWDDLAFCVDLSSSEDGAMGVLIRYRDNQNYYRFSMNGAENYHRLEKCVNGTMTVLWQSVSGFDLDRTYHLCLQAEGAEIRGFLDGQALFAVIDGDIATGSVGLYTWNNGGATFSHAWVLSLARYVGAFRIFDGGGLSGRSSWRTRFGELQQRSALGGAAAPNLGTHAVAPPEIASDMRLVVKARSDSDTPFGVLFRYRDEANYYRFSVSTADHVRRLIKMVDGASTTLWEIAGGYSPGAAHSFTIDTIGDRITGYFDGEKLFDIRDASFAGGRAGIYSSRNDSVAFDLVQISTPPIEAYALFTDKFADDDVSDWTFVSEATAADPPHWVVADGILTQTSHAFSPPTSPASIERKGLYAVAGDPAWGDVVFRAQLQSLGRCSIGVMFRYQDQDHYYRFSMDHIHKHRRLVKNVGGVFTRLWEDDFQFTLGSSYEVVIVAIGNHLWGYFDGAPMFVVEDEDLAAGRVALYCWRNPNSKFSCVTVLPVEAAFTDWAFADNFPYLVVDKWAFTDVGMINAPSQWAVVDGHLVQTASISGDNRWEGTFAVSDKGSRDWSDYRFTANLVSSSTGVIGLAARYQDPDNHYRFEIGSETLGRRLVKRVNGIEEELWSDPNGYSIDAPQLATIECLGTRITCYVNGVKICEVADDALAKGRIALFTFENPGAGFSFVRVQEAAWQNYYRFGKGPTVPAGHRIRLLAGGESDAPAPLPNVHDLFVAGPGERGSLHFYDAACDLRISNPLGKVMHARTFLDSSRYTPVPAVRLLRQRDGCGFFLALPAAVPEGSRFEKAEYRLKLTYRLDNTANNSNSQIQREAGLSDPEVTQIDLPSLQQS